MSRLLEGIKKAKEVLVGLAVNADNAFRRGMQEFGEFFKDKIIQTRPNVEEYNKIDVLETPEGTDVQISPKTEYQPLRHFEGRILQPAFLCPWWEEIQEEEREQLLTIDDVNNTYYGISDELTNRIVEKLSRELNKR